MKKISRALISVSDKTGLVDFARRLAANSVEIISTGGTARSLREAGLEVRDVSDLTGFPEILGGRVKTLHPKVHGALLAVREDPEHQQQVQANDISYIDMVVVNLYPFRETVARKDVTVEDAIENIDIGGPSMIRSAAKNFNDVVVVVDPSDYAAIAEELEQNDRRVSLATRFSPRITPVSCGTRNRNTAPAKLTINAFPPTRRSPVLSAGPALYARNTRAMQPSARRWQNRASLPAARSSNAIRIPHLPGCIWR